MSRVMVNDHKKLLGARMLVLRLRALKEKLLRYVHTYLLLRRIYAQTDDTTQLLKNHYSLWLVRTRSTHVPSGLLVTRHALR